MMLILKMLAIPFNMKCFTDFKDFDKLNFINTSQFFGVCGIGINVSYFTDEKVEAV